MASILNNCEELGSKERVDDSTIQNQLQYLNHSMIGLVEQIVQGSQPTDDLWQSFRKLNAEYKTKRQKLTEKPDEADRGLDPVLQPSQNFERTRIPQGEITIPYPLSPDVARLVCDVAEDRETNPLCISHAPVSRSKLFGILEKGELIYDENPRAVIKLSSNLVVKISNSVDTTEIHNLAHLRITAPKIPVPEPLGMIAVGKRAYIFMSLITGVTLDNIWEKLGHDQKIQIKKQLDQIFTELRMLPIPSKEGFLGGGVPTICKDARRWIKYSLPFISTEAEFNNFLLDDLLDSASTSYLSSKLPTNHRIVMTHGDLRPENLIVRNENDLDIVGIIDWELGGGYPEYWEYVKAMDGSFFRNDFHLFLPEAAIGNFFDELGRENIIRKLSA